jgi:hypothetical protein
VLIGTAIAAVKDGNEIAKGYGRFTGKIVEMTVSDGGADPGYYSEIGRPVGGD